MKKIQRFLTSVVLFLMLTNSVFAGTFWVDTNADTDPNTCVEDEAINDDDCTLRDAVSQLSTGDTIKFLENETVTNANGTYTLSVNNVTLDGTTGGYTIALNGNGASNDGITITGDGITVQGLYIYGFDGGDGNAGIVVNSTADATTIQNNVMGLQTDGSTVDANDYGIYTSGTNLTVDSNTISGNSIMGIKIGTSAKDVVIKGNKIGTNSAGTTAKGNGDGIGIGFNGATGSLNGGDGGVEGIVIGGDETAERNIISGNTQQGITIGDPSDIISGNIAIQGNYIGLGSDGSTQIANSNNGISTGGTNIATGVDWLIGTNGDGTNDSAEGNVISGNGGLGINIDSGDDLFISGNKIGFAVDGTTAKGNTFAAVQVDAANIRIGSDLNGTSDSVEGNLIGNSSGLDVDGIFINGSEPDTIKIYGNMIGVDANGANSHGNTGSGIDIIDTSADVTTINIGGVGPTAASDGRNVISNNSKEAVFISSAGPGSTVTIQNNIMGYQSNGTTSAGNGQIALNIADSGGTMTVLVGTNGNGTNDTNEGNIIGNSGGVLGAGISVGIGVNTLTVAGNTIKSNSADGIDVVGTDFTGTVTIGGDAAAERNIIGSNGTKGISVRNLGSTSTNLTIQNNYVGVDSNGSTAIGNASEAISVSGPPGLSIGAITIKDNVCANSTSANVNGILVTGGTGLTIQGNKIGVAADGTTAAKNGTGNSDGIAVSASSLTSVIIGGATAALGNVIAGRRIGITVDALAASTTPVTIQGNYIGVGSDGVTTTGLGATEDAIMLTGYGAVTIGGDNDLANGNLGEGNVLSNNGKTGIKVSGTNVSSLSVYGNIIGLIKNGIGGVYNTADGNSDNGIYVGSPSIATLTIGAKNGTTVASRRNVISANGISGVYIDPLTNSSLVANIINNYIGTDITGLVSGLGNGVAGILVDKGTFGIGDSTSDGKNVISGNTGSGIGITGGNVTVKGNYIGVNAAGTAALPNGSAEFDAQGDVEINSGGIVVVEGGTVTIGGDRTAGEGNVISGNYGQGVAYLGGATTFALLGNYIGVGADGTTAIPNQQGTESYSLVSGVTGFNGSGVLVYDAGYVDEIIPVTIQNSVSGAQIGGTTSTYGNVIAGNAGHGIAVTHDAIGATSGLGQDWTNGFIKNNFLGMLADGITALANTGNEIYVNPNGGTLTNFSIGLNGANTINNTSHVGVRLDNVTDSNLATSAKLTNLWGNNIWSDTIGPFYADAASYFPWKQIVSGVLGDFGPKQCADRVDNDGNGLADYPLDSAACSSLLDDDETAPGGVLIGGGSARTNDTSTSSSDDSSAVSDTANAVIDEIVDTINGTDGEVTTVEPESETTFLTTQLVEQILNNAVNTVIDEPSISDIIELVDSHNAPQDEIQAEQTTEQEIITKALTNLGSSSLNKAATVVENKIKKTISEALKEGQGVIIRSRGKKIKADKNTEVEFYWSVEEAKKQRGKKIAIHPSTDSNGDGLADVIAVIEDRSIMEEEPVNLNEQYYFEGNLSNRRQAREEILPRVPKITNIPEDDITIGKESLLWIGYNQKNKDVEIFVVDPKTLKEYFVDEVTIGEDNKATYILNLEEVEDFELEEGLQELYIVVQDPDGESSLTEVIVDPDLEFEANSVSLTRNPDKQAKSDNLAESLYSSVLLAAAVNADDADSAGADADADEPYILTGYTEPGTFVYATWKSLTYSSVVIADASQGYFEIEAPEGLEEGNHEALVYVYDRSRKMIGNITSLLFSK